MTGTDQNVGPGKYETVKSAFPSYHRKFPIYSIGKGKRPPLNPKPWTKSETYWTYSSMGSQVQSKKKTEEMVKIGKSILFCLSYLPKYFNSNFFVKKIFYFLVINI
jgi:hypothetical protein